MSPRRETVVVEADPPAYPGGYGTIRTVEVHHYHTGPRGSCSRAFMATALLLLITFAFSAVCFVAWNFYNLSELLTDSRAAEFYHASFHFALTLFWKKKTWLLYACQTKLNQYFCTAKRA
ncbi:hypothetical protein P171DRAFT_444332 [Karstenula rhodostoma CBS 690.94]|uniref:Uncharacterized protein n=1 Tax=Karstenula rhodostoma CBS 690.94 TaxID=1392251 RepID=A0A9P4PHF9_9PLEO|nr:hypothetical protein P171DRAFT_444332 [Karstenula rhodostoma CBS 690.94]